MKVVKNGYSDGDFKGHIRDLNDNEKRILGAVWTPNSDPWREQQELLLALRENHHWLVCSCQDKSPPIMFPRRYPSGTYGLVNHADHRNHDPECPFWKMTRPDAADEKIKLKKTRQRFDFCFHRQITEKLDEEEKDDLEPDEEKKSRSKGDPGLVKLIYLLVSLARLDRFDGQCEYREEEAINRICTAAQLLTLNRLFTIRQWLYTDIRELESAIRRLNASESEWCRSGRPHALFLLLVDKIGFTEDGRFKVESFHKPLDGGDWQVMTHEFPAHFQVVMPGRIHSQEGGPFILLFTVAVPPKSPLPFYSECKGAIVPILTKNHPLPVDSRFERETLKALRKQMKWWRDNRRTWIEVFKPNFDLIAPQSQLPVRPDIVLEHKNRKVILEVMGSHSEEYRASKAITVPRMFEIAPVVEFDALAADLDNQLKERCWQAAADAIRALLTGELPATTPVYPDTVTADIVPPALE